MATARSYITAALQDIKTYSAGESPSSEDATRGLAILNDMLFAWMNEGIDLGFIEVALEDEIEVPPDHNRTIRLNLAREFAGPWGGTLSPDDVKRAEDGLTALRAIYFRIADLTSDNPLAWRNLANGERYWWP